MTASPSGKIGRKSPVSVPVVPVVSVVPVVEDVVVPVVSVVSVLVVLSLPSVAVVVSVSLVVAVESVFDVEPVCEPVPESLSLPFVISSIGSPSAGAQATRANDEPTNNARARRDDEEKCAKDLRRCILAF